MTSSVTSDGSVDVGKYLADMIQDAAVIAPIRASVFWHSAIKEWRMEATWDFGSIKYNDTADKPVTWVVRENLAVTAPKDEDA